MYFIGYFSIRIDDGLGGGYGFYSFNLNSFFNPLGFNNITGFSWSFFLRMLNLTILIQKDFLIWVSQAYCFLLYV